MALVFGLLTIAWFEHNFLWEWDFWAGTFGLAVMAVLEVVLFMWVFGPENAWRSLHRGADIRIPRVFRFVMTYVTPLDLLVVLLAWGWQDALPILTLSRSPVGGPVPAASEAYVHVARLLILGFVVFFVVMIRLAWSRSRYEERDGFPVVEDTTAGTPVAEHGGRGRG